MSIMERAPQAIEIKSVTWLFNLAELSRRMLDVVSAVVLILLLCPLLCIVTAAVYIESGRPIIFRQTRTGKDGKTFKIYKFRTMYVLEDGNTVKQAICGDKRVTPVGRWLRRTSIDELPQLCNVIKGDMSLVGPRPHAVVHDEYYSKLIPRYLTRQQVKPGITGLAQVSGARGETPHLSDMERRIELDLWYVQNRTLLLDLKILLLTVLTLTGNENIA